MVIRITLNIGGCGDGCSVHLWHEGLMIEIQCQLVICRVHIRVPKDTFQICD